MWSIVFVETVLLSFINPLRFRERMLNNHVSLIGQDRAARRVCRVFQRAYVALDSLLGQEAFL